jgi:hypothetical protein
MPDKTNNTENLGGEITGASDTPLPLRVAASAALANSGVGEMSPTIQAQLVTAPGGVAVSGMPISPLHHVETQIRVSHMSEECSC